MLMNEVRGEAVLRKLPPAIVQSFSTAQLEAIRRVAGDVAPRRHPIDTRMSFRVPLLGGVYLVFLLGKEKRSPQRIAFEREVRPTDRIGRAVLFILVGSGLLLALLVGILFENAILSG